MKSLIVNNKKILAILFMTVGMFCLGVNDVNVKWLNQDYPVWEVVFFRGISGLIISLGLVIRFGIKSLKTNKPVAHIIRAFSAVACVTFYFFGLKFLSLSENNALAHSAPIIACVLAVPILGEKLGIRRLIAVIVGFVGVIIIVQPGSEIFKVASLLPVASAISMAVSYISLRFIMKTDSSVSIIFYYSVALVITTIVFFPSDFKYPPLIHIIPLFSLGVMGSLGHYFISQAAKRAETVVITPFQYTSFIWVIIMGYIFYNEIPSRIIIFGGLLIIISGIYIVYREHIKNKKIIQQKILNI